MLVNAHRIEGDFVYISLTLGQETKIDVADLDLVLQHKWHAAYLKERDCYYARGNINGKNILLHRFLLNAPRELVVDHLNHDTLNNSRSNLRLVTHATNRANLSGPTKRSSTGILNVYVLPNAAGNPRYVTCVVRGDKIRQRWYPYTEEGKSAAIRQADRWREDIDATEEVERKVAGAHEYQSEAPKARSTSKTGILGVSIYHQKDRHGKHREYYMFRCHHKNCKVVKYFPLTDEGLSDAQYFSDAHHSIARSLPQGVELAELLSLSR